MKKTAKMLAAVAVLSLSGFGAASASEYFYESTLPRAAVQQHKAYVKSLERAAARKEKQAKSQAVSSGTADPAVTIGVVGIVTAIIIAAAL